MWHSGHNLLPIFLAPFLTTPCLILYTLPTQLFMIPYILWFLVTQQLLRLSLWPRLLSSSPPYSPSPPLTPHTHHLNSTSYLSLNSRALQEVLLVPYFHPKSRIRILTSVLLVLSERIFISVTTTFSHNELFVLVFYLQAEVRVSYLHCFNNTKYLVQGTQQMIAN